MEEPCRNLGKSFSGRGWGRQQVQRSWGGTTPGAFEELEGAHVAGAELSKDRETEGLGGGVPLPLIARGLYSFSVATITGKPEVRD